MKILAALAFVVLVSVSGCTTVLPGEVAEEKLVEAVVIHKFINLDEFGSHYFLKLKLRDSEKGEWPPSMPVSGESFIVTEVGQKVVVYRDVLKDGRVGCRWPAQGGPR